MAISREQKTELIEQYKEQLKECQGFILADFRGLSVGQMGEIRDAMRPLGARFQVIRNRLMVLALEDAGIELPREWLDGPTAFSFCTDEIPPVAKALVDSAKEFETLQIKGGLMNETVMEEADVRAIADLPSREVLLGQVLGGINAPATQMAGVVASGVRQVLNVLKAYADKLEESGGAEMEPAAEPA